MYEFRVEEIQLNGNFLIDSLCEAQKLVFLETQKQNILKKILKNMKRILKVHRRNSLFIKILTEEFWLIAQTDENKKKSEFLEIQLFYFSFYEFIRNFKGANGEINKCSLRLSSEKYEKIKEVMKSTNVGELGNDNNEGNKLFGRYCGQELFDMKQFDDLF